MRCSGCSEQFSSLKAFDTHRVGEFSVPTPKGPDYSRHTRRCLDHDEMREIGLVLNEQKEWSVPISEKDKQRFVAMRQIVEE
jgi:hypothetical protein